MARPLHESPFSDFKAVHLSDPSIYLTRLPETSKERISTNLVPTDDSIHIAKDSLGEEKFITQ